MEKGRLMMIIIIALLVLLLGTVVGVTVYVLGLVRTAEDPNAAQAQQVERQYSMDEITPVSLGDPIQTNLQPGLDGTAHFANITLEIGYDNTQGSDSTDLGTLLGVHIKAARSVALECLYSKTAEELQAQDGMKLLEAEILEKLQEYFNTNLIVSVTVSDRLIT